MRETRFIAQNKDKWEEFERLLKDKSADPQQLGERFVSITDDLSYARTFYPKRSVRVYLNGLAQGIYQRLYKSQKAEKGSIGRFWLEELPHIMWESRRALWLSFGVFMLALSIGVLSCAMNPEFPRVILGDRYVDMTLANIENGDPMAVYKQMNEVDMTLGITLNNLRVSLLSFISGLLMGIGTLGVMLYNGIMVGAFQYFFYEQGELRESFLTIWIHGTIEISTIILSGCAGLVLGRGLVFPGTFTRLQALQYYGLRAFKIMLGTVPLVILAGIIEGFVTRYTDAPDVLRLGIILSSLSFVLLYFVWYPWQKHREGFRYPIRDIRVPAYKQVKLELDAIKPTARLFMETFQVYGRQIGGILRGALLLAIAYTLLLAGHYASDLPQQIGFGQSNDFWSWFFYTHIINLGQFFDYGSHRFLLLLNTLIFGSTVYYAGRYVWRAIYPDAPPTSGSMHLTGWLGAVGMWGLFNVMLWRGGGFMVLAVAAFPFLMLWLTIMLYEQRNPFTALRRMLALAQPIGAVYALYFVLLLIAALFSYLVSSPILWFLIDIVGMNVSADVISPELIFSLLLTFIFALFFCAVFPLFMISAGLLMGSLRERKEANALRQQIQKVGTSSRLQGLARER